MTSTPGMADSSYRKALKVAVCGLACEVGFGTAEDLAVETLSEMMQSLLTELGRSARTFSELSGRTEPILSDVSLALVEMGMDIEALQSYARRPNKVLFMPPQPAMASATPRTLQAGQKQSHPHHIPDYLPAFPDPHTYIHTLTHKQPANEYQLIREKAASQKRDVERGLTRFIAKTGETEGLFSDDPYAFPLIANNPKPLPYLDALLQKDLDLEALEEEDKKTSPQEQSDQKAERESPVKSATPSSAQEQSTTPQGKLTHDNSGTGASLTSATPLDILDTEGQIDNPFLRPIKMPKLKGTGKKHKW